jgi:hypothetical protein
MRGTIRLTVLACLASLFLSAGSVLAQDRGEVEQLRRDLDEMKRTMEQMQEMMRRQEELIRKLEAEGARAAPEAGTADAALDQALAEAEAAAPVAEPRPLAPSRRALASARVGGATLRLIDISTDIIAAAGWSTATNDQLEDLQGGAHDPKRRGFTLQQAELGFSGAVDPYFRGDMFVVFTDTSVELEEAFLTTTSLPWRLQLEAGLFLTEFGVNNPRHPHQWTWVDQPVINTRLFGGEGLRNPGFRVGWLLPTSWFSELHLGAQNAQGETAISFFGADDGTTSVGGRPAVFSDVLNLGDLLYLVRWENVGTRTVFDGTATARLGGSALFGPNSTGRDARTRIYGADLTVKWRRARNFRGWPHLTWQTEWMQRDFEAAAVDDDGDVGSLPARTLFDWGIYSELFWGFRYPWGLGLRYEYATGTGQSVGGRENDAFRDNRQRLSPLVSYQPTEFSRIRLQYNWDRADMAPTRDANSVWTSFEILFGAHPAHNF